MIESALLMGKNFSGTVTVLVEKVNNVGMREVAEPTMPFLGQLQLTFKFCFRKGPGCQRQKPWL